MEARSVKASPPNAFLHVAKGVAITVVMGLLMAILPLAPMFIVPFLVLPLAYVVARWGFLQGLVLAVVAGTLVYAGVGVSTAALVLLLILGTGMAMGWAVRRSWRFESSLASTASATFFALVLWGVVLWLVAGVGLTDLKEAAYGAIDDAAIAYTQMGMGVETAGTVSDQLRHIVDIVPYLTPGLLGMAAILASACSLGLAYLFFPRLGEKTAVSWTLSGFRMHWATAYASIVGLAMVLFARGDGGWTSAVTYVGINILLVSQTLFFLQGMAVTRWFVVSRQLARGSRTLLYLAAILGQVLFQLTGLVGLFDTWLNYRKRFAPKSPGASSAG